MHGWKSKGVHLLVCWLLLPLTGRCADVTRRLAETLAEDGSHAAAAVEYRRLALMADDAGQRAGYYWAAAHEYWRNGDGESAARMLDKAEDSDPAIGGHCLLLRSEVAMARPGRAEAIFYAQSARRTHTNDMARLFFSRRLAHALLADGQSADARQTLLAFPAENEAAIEAVDRYQSGASRSPVLGGLLGGLLPGSGHAYSGEYANALRSLLINGLFVYAMVETAEDEQWGAFAAVAFFELTWYTGSIYGGIDAAHRYNRNRLADCTEAVDGGARLVADLSQIPVLAVRFEF